MFTDEQLRSFVNKEGVQVFEGDLLVALTSGIDRSKILTSWTLVDDGQNIFHCRGTMRLDPNMSEGDPKAAISLALCQVQWIARTARDGSSNKELLWVNRDCLPAA